MEPGEARTRRTGAPVTVLLLSLYLVLLAFFILLVSHSRIDPVRVGAALGSLKSTFDDLPVTPSPPALRPLDPVLGKVAEGVGELVATEIAAGRVTVVHEGGRLEVNLRAADLFAAGQARPLPGREALPKGLAKALAGTDGRFELLCAASRRNGGAGAQGTLEARRAAALAEAVVAAGAPAALVSAVVEGGPADGIRLSFRPLDDGGGG